MSVANELSPHPTAEEIEQLAIMGNPNENSGISLQTPRTPSVSVGGDKGDDGPPTARGSQEPKGREDGPSSAKGSPYPGVKAGDKRPFAALGLFEQEDPGWELDEDLARDLEDSMGTFLEAKERKEKLTDKFPRPNNIRPVPELDKWVSTLTNDDPKLRGKDSDFKSVQGLILDALGPLLKATQQVQRFCKADRDPSLDDEDMPEIDAHEVCNNLLASVALLGQGFTKVNWLRRVGAVSQLSLNSKIVRSSGRSGIVEFLNSKKAKEMLAVEKECLLGPNFHEFISAPAAEAKQVLEAMETVKKVEKLMKDHSSKQPSSFTSEKGSDKPHSNFDSRARSGFRGRKGGKPFRKSGEKGASSRDNFRGQYRAERDEYCRDDYCSRDDFRTDRDG